MAQLVLASHSPRRQELLRQIGVDFHCCGADIDESFRDGEAPRAYVERLALDKALAIRDHFPPDHVILGSDTAVVCGGRVLGKPRDEADAVAMLMQLSGKKHQVMTSVGVVCGERRRSLVVTTEVLFRTLTPAECKTYWQTGEPRDKAGAYGIQGLGAVFVERIQGSYSAVVGLPLLETAQLLNELGVPVWQVPCESPSS